MIGNNAFFLLKKFKFKIIFFTLLLLTVPLLLSGCARHSRYVKKVSKMVKVNAIKTSYKTINNYISSPGNVYSLNNTYISAHIMGYVIYNHIHLGEYVRKGQLLLKLSAPEIKSKYFAAKAGYLNAKKTYKRLEKLYKENSISRQSYDNALMNFRVAEANLNASMSYLNYKNIYSPITGIITRKNVSTGNLVSPGQMLFIIQAVNKIIFKSNVSVEYYSLLLKNKNVVLEFNSVRKILKGKIISIVKSANPYSHSVIVRIDIISSIPNHILPGMYGIAKFTVGKEKAIIIPKKVLIKKLGIYGVYLANREGIVMFQPIKKGPSYNKLFLIVISGLKPGLTLITSNLNKIKTGSYVYPAYVKK